MQRTFFVVGIAFFSRDGWAIVFPSPTDRREFGWVFL